MARGGAERRCVKGASSLSSFVDDFGRLLGALDGENNRKSTSNALRLAPEPLADSRDTHRGFRWGWASREQRRARSAAASKVRRRYAVHGPRF